MPAALAGSSLLPSRLSDIFFLLAVPFSAFLLALIVYLFVIDCPFTQQKIAACHNF